MLNPSLRPVLALKTATWLPLCAALSVVASGGSSAEAAPANVKSSVTAGPKAETDNYIIELKGGGPYRPGAPGTFEVFLTPKGSYHTNAQYPYRFKTNEPPDGLTYSKPNMVRADGSFEEKKGSFKIPFVAARPGKYAVGGTFFFSVCSEANCIMDKVALDTTIEVK